MRKLNIVKDKALEWAEEGEGPEQGQGWHPGQEQPVWSVLGSTSSMLGPGSSLFTVWVP